MSTISLLCVRRCWHRYAKSAQVQFADPTITYLVMEVVVYSFEEPTPDGQQTAGMSLRMDSHIVDRKTARMIREKAAEAGPAAGIVGSVTCHWRFEIGTRTRARLTNGSAASPDTADWGS